MEIPKAHSAVVQSKSPSIAEGDLPLAVTNNKRIPPLPTPYHVLVRVLTVGLNPTDYKMVTHFYMEGNTVGCDFCGIVVDAGPLSGIPLGTKVIGADFPYRPNNPDNGAFAEYAVSDARQTVIMPNGMDEITAAALGGIGWGTACLAFTDPDALYLKGWPSTPVEKPVPVLVYGGATATGIVAIQVLKHSGYDPIAVCSDRSAKAVMGFGAIGTASYTATDCLEKIKSIAGGRPIKYALDCITDPESVSICFGALSRVGGRYACLEDCPEAWRPRRSVKVKVVMGFESRNVDVDLGHPVYTRKANQALYDMGVRWTTEMQSLLDQGAMRTGQIHEVEGGLQGVIKGLHMLRNGEVNGRKIVVRIADS